MRKLYIALAALALGAPLSAQNINQSVQVTNDYVGRFADFQKMGAVPQVPDSLYRFDYKFDYSVFDTPYKGAYEFTPYEIRVTPEARPYDGSRFYLRAGAGYSLHPQLMLAWQALQRENLTVGVFADASGYAGQYRRSKDADPFRGHDISGRAGVGGQYLLPAATLSWQLAYEGIAAGEDVDAPRFRSGFNAAVVNGRVQSRERPGDFLFYDIDLRYRYASDAYAPVLNRANLGENNFHLGVSGGPVLNGKYRILLDALFEMDALRETGIASPQRFSASLAALRPHVDFLLGPVQLDAGARIDYAECGEDKRFTVSPDVIARLDLIERDLRLFAAVSGGQSLVSHYDVRHISHFSYRLDTGTALSREKIRARIGIDGHWNSRLQYGFEAGYVSYAGLPLDGCPFTGPIITGYITDRVPWPVTAFVGQADFQSAYARAKLSWADERVQVDGNLGYAHHILPEEEFPVYTPPAFTADVRGSYNWQKRIFAGAFVEAASARTPMAAWAATPIRGYANLGLTGEFRVDRRWGVWAEAGNLLCMDIERVPGYIERGPYVTLGVSLKL
ncbi:MAG: hypothetical protein IJ603_05405 [Bacteroidales bacterium]|nr:hypothetical protein [Bacteroidales bacterium]